MLTIRLFRIGKKNQAFFRIVVTDKRRSSTKGRSVEEIGFYNPLTKEKKIDGERAKYWISKGAKPSDSIYNMLVSEKIVEGKKIPNFANPPAGGKKEPKKPEAAQPAPVAPAAPAPEEKKA
jgi:small subunit ribosomal protein S16